ncbi:hypothetical protein [Streptomyces phaeofaciens]|uniref:hypothetical protein n=1 Tax=Streptomyces phaeofaciens TaxID=68254 RepID=UPI0016767367|nr:hypothetical protein [Streptomyces phaeofaciens]
MVRSTVLPEPACCCPYSSSVSGRCAGTGVGKVVVGLVDRRAPGLQRGFEEVALACEAADRR